MATEMALNGLIYQRLRRRGDIEVYQQKLRASQEKIANAESVLAELRAEVLTLQTNVEKARADVANLTEALALAFGYEDDNLDSRKTYPKTHRLAWGGLTRTVVATLRKLSVADADRIAAMVASDTGLVFNTVTEYKRYRRHIGRTLKDMGARGIIERLHSATSNQCGIWALKASSE